MHVDRGIVGQLALRQIAENGSALFPYTEGRRGYERRPRGTPGAQGSASNWNDVRTSKTGSTSMLLTKGSRREWTLKVYSEHSDLVPLEWWQSTRIVLSGFQVPNLRLFLVPNFTQFSCKNPKQMNP